MRSIDLVDPDDQAYAEYSENFSAYNAANSTWNWRSYSCVLRIEGQIVAGGRGVINMGALEVRGLWVDETLRGKGVGRDLLVAIEDEARKRGATRAMLFTFSFQAEEFYRRMGYETFAKFEYPDGPQRIDMKKEL